MMHRVSGSHFRFLLGGWLTVMIRHHASRRKVASRFVTRVSGQGILPGSLVAEIHIEHVHRRDQPRISFAAAFGVPDGSEHLIGDPQSSV